MLKRPLLVGSVNLNGHMVLAGIPGQSSLVLFGVFAFMKYPAFQTLLVDVTPPQLRATVLGLYFFSMMEGMSLAQPIVGYFIDIWGINQVFSVIGLITVGLSVVTLFWAIKNRSSANTLSTGEGS